MSDDRVAVLGLGTMGGAIAANLHQAGYTVAGYNRSERASPSASSFSKSTDAATALRGASIILVMLTDAPATNAVLLNPTVLDAFEPDAVVVNMGTIGVDQTAELAAALAVARPDLVFVDAPVSGSKIPAENGTLTILASSDNDAGNSADADAHSLRRRLAPVFDVIGRRTLWLGGTGAGSAMKIVLNTWLVHVMHGIAETALLAERFGIHTETLVDTLSGGPLDTPYASAKLRKIGASDWSAEMALSLGAKDARLAVLAAADLDLPVTSVIAQTWTEAALSSDPLASSDVAVIHEVLRTTKPRD
jgi:3-hydroxyisobutyrate dehydrogenase